MSQKIKYYDSPHLFEPLMPSDAVIGPLLERASDLGRAAGQLRAVGGQNAHQGLQALLRSMNSYYSNKIEGDHTRPSDIERALSKDFSINAELARKQRLAIAHINTEFELEQIVAVVQPAQSWMEDGLYSQAAIEEIHRSLFSKLLKDDLRLGDGGVMTPGRTRSRQVAVGRHEAPLHTALPAFIRRWADVYQGARRGEYSIVAAAASHHRLAWIHPFPDGNGRVARLHTHLLMHSMGLSTGLWSPLRGFARSEERYKALLAAADEHRRGDLDGRGNLTQAGLIDWISYTLDTCIDQAEFMTEQLATAGMKDRIQACLTFEQDARKTGVRTECLIPLHYLFVTQSELARADFKTMTGLGERVATQALSSLLKRGFLATDSAYGKVRFAVPSHALRFYFPSLWPEAEKDQTLLENKLSF